MLESILYNFEENKMQNKVNEWLNSGEYISDVDELRTSIMKQSAKSNSEATTANVFERELYYIIRKRTGIILEIIKEQTVSGINHTFGELVKRRVVKDAWMQ